MINDTHARFRAIVAAVAATFDLRDAFFFGGLALAGYGGALISRPWTCIAIGAVLALKGHGPFIIRRGSE